MIVEEINEENYQQKIFEGEARLQLKFDYYESVKNDPKLIELLNSDPTIWAYSILKDKQNQPLKLLPFQDMLVNDKNTHVMAVGAAQVGKTTAICVKALHHATRVPNASVIIGSASESQAVMILDEIKGMMQRSNLNFTPVIDAVDNRTELHVKNSDGKGISKIKCFAPTDKALGFPASLLLLDELGAWENGEELYYRVFESRTQAMKNLKHPFQTMGQIFIISNPNGQVGILWRLWSQDDRFSKYRYCWLANPANTMAEYEAHRQTKPSDWFESMYAGVFSSETGGFITGAEYNDAVRGYVPINYSNMTLFLGADLAGEDTLSRDTDAHVLRACVVEQREGQPPIFHLPYRKGWKKIPKEEVYAEIQRLKETYSVFGLAYDKVGVGDSVKNELIDRGIFNEYQIMPLTYSLQNKAEVFYNMKLLFEQRRIRMQDDPVVREQMMGLRFVRIQGSIHIKDANLIERRVTRVKIHHEDSHVHDDECDAIANALYLASRSLAIPVSVTVVTLKSFKEEKPRGHKLVTCDRCEEYYYKENEHECQVEESQILR